MAEAAQQQIDLILARANTKRVHYKFPDVSLGRASEILFAKYEYQCALRNRLVENPDEVRRTCDKVARWLTDLSTRPWLAILGKMGTGKTVLMRAIGSSLMSLRGELTKGLDYMDKLKLVEKRGGNGWGDSYFVSAIDLATLATDPDRRYTYTEHILGNKQEHYLLIDDVGQDPVEFKSYGNAFIPFVEIINKRYDAQYPVIITSNLSLTEIGNRYGERITDRFKEMAEQITFTGKSYR